MLREKHVEQGACTPALIKIESLFTQAAAELLPVSHKYTPSRREPFPSAISFTSKGWLYDQPETFVSHPNQKQIKALMVYVGEPSKQINQNYLLQSSFSLLQSTEDSQVMAN